MIRISLGVSGKLLVAVTRPDTFRIEMILNITLKSKDEPKVTKVLVMVVLRRIMTGMR